MKERKLEETYIREYIAYLYEEEKSIPTIQKYTCDIRKFYAFAQDKPITKETVLKFKNHLKKTYKISSVNSMIVALNRFFVFLSWDELKVKELKVQKQLFSKRDKTLTKKEYVRLLKAAKSKKNERLVMLMQGICATGIRVSEHQFITVEALKDGFMTITNKGKTREVFFPKELRLVLLKYCAKYKIKTGSVFVTRTGKPLDRSNIWTMMKALCEEAKIDRNKVYPHSLRHLFAATYYDLEKDVIHLAAILGHSNIETTRIYIGYNSQECVSTFNKMQLTQVDV